MNITHHKKIVIDARMINISGIGRYIQAFIPALINQFENIVLLGNVAEISKFYWHNQVVIIELNDPIYSIKEQWSLLGKTPACDIFLSPHYNVPVYLPQAKKTAVIIPDTNHLVFGKDLSFVKRAYAKLFFKIAVSKDIIFTISHFSKSEIVKFTKCDPAKVIVGTLAIDKDHFKALNAELESNGLPPGAKPINDDYILYIGNIKPHKNLKRALLAFEQVSVSYPKLKFLIVGKKDNFLTGDNEVFKMVEGNDTLSRKVDFTGKVTDMYLAYLYKNAKAFLFPSLYEGFGLPPLEAMIFGCPVIVSKEGSLPEICGDAARYCNAYDVNDIADAIRAVLSDIGLRDALITKGLVKVNEYDWSHFNSIIANGLAKL